MNQTKIFDNHVREMHSFTFDEMLSALSGDPNWTKDGTYLRSIISDRIKKHLIEVSNDKYAFVQRDNGTVAVSQSRPTFKYPHPILATDELNGILSHGVDICQNTDYCNLVKLSNSNSEIIESLIANDDRYKFLFSKRVFDSFVTDGNFARTRDAYCAVLRVIDIDNSTQVFKNHRDDFYRMLDYIMDDEQAFYDRIRRGDIILIDDLVNVCSTNLLSFCSKACKFLNNWLFDGDGYYIYDYYVLNAIPFYFDYYRRNSPDEFASKHINAGNLNSRRYQDFYDILSKVHELRDNEFSDQISKHHLDHVIWYSYRSFKQKLAKILFI